MTTQSIKKDKPLSPRGEELDQVSRKRSLTEIESLELEREILFASGQRVPPGLIRDLARHGIKPINSKSKERRINDQG